MNTRSISLPAAISRALIVLSVTFPAWAHDLELFAAIDSGQVRGTVTYDDRPAAGVHVQILGPNDMLLGQVESDDSGSFQWTPQYRTGLHLVAETAEGHRAKTHLSADTLPSELSDPPPGYTGLGTVSDADRTVEPAHTHDDHTASDHEIEYLIEDAVSSQVYPLRQQLNALEHRIRFQDVLGGIGYILGLFGIAVLVKNRKSRPAK